MKRKIVFIGNSIVNGFPFKRSLCFVSLVREETGFDVINKGNNGETTGDILLRFDRDVINHRPDYVFIMTGTNDFIYGQASPEEAFENLCHMTEKAKAAGIKTILLTPVPVDEAMAAERWMTGAGIDYPMVNRSLREISKLIIASGIPYIDLNSAYANCLMYHDGVHPLPEGHRFIADEIINYLKETEIYAT